MDALIGSLAHSQIAPHDYRVALDAALICLGARPALLCRASQLVAELHQRLPAPGELRGARAALWVEPQALGWQADLAMLAAGIVPGGRLALIASRPLARLLPERRGWDGQPLGMRPHGLATLRHALRRGGWRLIAIHGFHSVAAILLSQVGALCERVGRPDIGDRMGIAARLRYRTDGALAGLATVTLIVVQRHAAAGRS